MASGHAARREAASRLPPLADGRRDPVLEVKPLICHICGGHPERGGALVWIFGQWMCRDRFECYQRWRGSR